MIVIAISLAAVTAFSSCNKDDDDKKNNGNNPGGVPATLPTQQQLNAVGISTALPEMTGTLVGSDYNEGITLKWSNSGERSYSAICTWLVGENRYSYIDESETATYLMYEAEKSLNTVSYAATVIYFMKDTQLEQLTGKAGEILLVIEQGGGSTTPGGNGNTPGGGGGGINNPTPEKTFGKYTLPENLKIVFKSANANDQTTVIKVGNDYYCTALKNSGLQNVLNYLKYDQTAGNWHRYSRTTGVANSPWSEGETVTEANIDGILASGNFYGFVLTFGSYFSETGTDTFLSRPVTLYNNGMITVYVDNEYGIILKSSDTYGVQTKQVLELSTSASFDGIDLPQ